MDKRDFNGHAETGAPYNGPARIHIDGHGWSVPLWSVCVVIGGEERKILVPFEAEANTLKNLIDEKGVADTGTLVTIEETFLAVTSGAAVSMLMRDLGMGEGDDE